MALHYLLDAAVNELLDAWCKHDDLRVGGRADHAQLAKSRWKLEAARERAQQLRSALCPMGEIIRPGSVVAYCSTLDQVVVVDRTGDGACICGHAVEGLGPPAAS